MNDANKENYARLVTQMEDDDSSSPPSPSSCVTQPAFSPLKSHRADESDTVIQNDKKPVEGDDDEKKEDDSEDEDDSDKKPSAKVKMEHTGASVDYVAKMSRTDEEDYELAANQEVGGGVLHKSRVYTQLRLLPGKGIIRNFQQAKRDRRIAWGKKQAWKKYPEETHENAEALFLAELEDDPLLRHEFYSEQNVVETVGIGKFTRFLEMEQQKTMEADKARAAAADVNNRNQIETDAALAAKLQKEEKLARNERLRRSFDCFDKKKED